jgi:hypothetical protein
MLYNEPLNPRKLRMHKDDSDEVPEISHQSKLLNLQKYEKTPQKTTNT